MWWQALNLMQKIYFCIATPATVLLIVQIILMIIGFSGGEADFDGDVDVDVDVDTENKILNDFNISQNSGFSWREFEDVIIAVIISLGIILFVVVAGYIIYRTIDDIRNKNSTNDVAPYVKIKRRKF